MCRVSRFVPALLLTATRAFFGPSRLKTAEESILREAKKDRMKEMP
jgi:hypothetical protein